MIGKKCVEMPLGCAFLNGSHVPTSKCPAIVALMRDSSTSMTMFMRNRQGRDVLISNNMVPRRDADGQVIELISFFTPLSSGKLVSEALPGGGHEPVPQDGAAVRRFACQHSRKQGQNAPIRLPAAGSRGTPSAVRKKNGPVLPVGPKHVCGDPPGKRPGRSSRRRGKDLDVLDGVEVTAEGRRETSRAFLGIALVREKDDIEDLLCRADRCRMQAANSKTDRFLTDLMEERAV